MSLSRRYFAALLLLGAAACASETVEPGAAPLALPTIQPRFVMPPGVTPASFGIAIDSARIFIYQQDTTCVECASGPTLLDTIVVLPASAPGLRLSVTLPPPHDSTQYFINLDMYGNNVFLFSGSSAISFHRGAFLLPPIPIYYYGPGNNADDIQMAPGDTALAVGDTLDFTATVYANAAPLDTSYISWRVSDTTVARIDHRGHLTLRSGALGHAFLVIASVPNGVATSARLAVPNTAAAILKISGDSQSVPIGQGTPAPLTVKVTDAQGKPVAGARVRFLPTVAATFAINDSAIYTDKSGLARSGASPLGLGAGTVRADVSGTPLHYDFTVTGTASAATSLLFAGDSGLSGYQLYRADSMGGGRVFLGYLNGSGIFYTAPRWNQARSRLAYTTYNGNTANYDLVLTTAAGDTTATLVSDAYASNARFDLPGKELAFNCGTLPNVLTAGDVCTVNAVNGVLGGLNGAGNGAGRTMVSAVVPGRPSGPPGYAWRPDASTRIAFGRDTLADSLSGLYATRFYQTNADGTALTPLSPRITDLGGGPLRAMGSIDWSPDGSTIVFSATDAGLSGYAASLYLLDVATGTVRRLTTAPSGWTGDLYPQFSPDGQRVLFKRVAYYYSYGMVMDYYVVRTVGGSPTRITYASTTWNTILDPFSLGGGWSPDGLSVLVSAPNALGGMSATRIPIDVTSAADVAARQIIVGTANIAGLHDWTVSWGP